MNQEMLPSRMSPPATGLSAAEAEWMQSAMQSALPPANAGAHAPTPLKKLHRLLRGRYWLVIILAVIGMAGGGVLGYMSQKPLYKSTGLLEYNPIISSSEGTERVMLLYNTFIQNQAALLQSQRVVSEALNTDEWKKTGRGATPEVMNDFMENLQVAKIPETSYLTVSFLDRDPAVAQTGATALILAYELIFKDTINENGKNSVNRMLDLKNQKSTAITNKKKEIEELGREFGTPDLNAYHSAQLEEQVRLGALLTRARFNFETVQNALGDGTPGHQPPPISNEDIATGGDRKMIQMLDDSQALAMQLNKLEKVWGKNHSRVNEARSNLELLQASIDAYGDDFRKKSYQLVPNTDGTGMQLISPQTASVLRAQVDRLEKLFEAQQRETARIGTIRTKITAATNEIARFQEEFENASRRYDELYAENQGKGKLTTMNPRSDAPLAPAVDRRRQMAILGGFGGAMLPIVLILAIGLLDSRYRYSDDAGNDMSGIPLLGILPNLPDLLTDPEQAAVAAHCVHQIRTMLQISAESQERRVFCITSPSPGDGKTSLSLALGLSFAASGSRTLLIDCDLVGAGLTSRMNVTSPEGVLESIANRSLLPYVQATDITNLAILPVGAAQAHHSSMLSPSAVRKIINEARSHFDVVLIDTGPILGSIEAGPVAAAADGVVLTVARGQQRPLVEKSMTHLMAIGARLAGVVFNRAQARDFEQSVSRLSLRSIPYSNGNGTNGHGEKTNHLGPVAKAVAHSVPNDRNS